MNDSYIYVITALLPLSALMLILQTNPYHALVIQGILGAVAALVFAVLGAADVALTQALMGTLLAITLYAIAVRSSLVMRLGVLEEGAINAINTDDEPLPDGKAVSIATWQECDHFQQLMDDMRSIFHKHYMRVEVVPYTNRQALYRALMDKEVHAACARRDYDSEAGRDSVHNQDSVVSQDEQEPYHTTTRVQRLYDIMRTELASPATSLAYVNASDSGEKHK
ncbi:hydrogenase subunit MbhD domain-containing protein [Lyngbya aestuarii]|uniref:hydrogenase subunit MbhD domain-containing protein n=1 Tax=Lyngbya aestuarii TaxID=118322 RepID=UPI00403D816A